MRRLIALLPAAALVAACFAAPARADDPYATIVSLEQARSLGGGELAAFLASPDERIAARAALALGRTRLPAAAPLLAEHVDDPRAAVRAMSIYGLGLVHTGAAFDAIVAAAVRDSSSAVRAAALDAIGRYQAAKVLNAARQERAAAAVRHALARDPDPLVRARAAPELDGFAGTPWGFASELALVRASRDPDVRVRRNVMWAIFRGYPLDVPRAVLAAGLHDGDEVVRIEAVRAFGRLKNADAIAALQPMLADPSWRVQEQAAESLLQLQKKPMHDAWTAIPAGVHLPPIAADPLADLSALLRTRAAGKPTAPVVADAPLEPKIDPRTAADMSGPAGGPHPRVRIVTTQGNVYVTLFPEWAPVTVENFLNVAESGYYDNNRWFRIVPDFVVQTGDPTDNGDGDAGYSVGAEENPLEQQSGVISMGMNYDANGPLRDSAGTQYYITLSPQLHLDRDFTVFGEVTSGFDVLAHLTQSDRVVRVERIADVTL